MIVNEDVKIQENNESIRKELLQYYKIAQNEPTPENISMYVESQKIIAPMIAISEILKVEELKDFIKNIEWSGNEDNTRCLKCGAFEWKGHEEWCDFPRMLNL